MTEWPKHDQIYDGDAYHAGQQGAVYTKADLDEKYTANEATQGPEYQRSAHDAIALLSQEHSCRYRSGDRRQQDEPEKQYRDRGGQMEKAVKQGREGDGHEHGADTRGQRDSDWSA